MSTPSRALQEAVVAALKSSAALTAIHGTPARVYDFVPAKPVFPYSQVAEIEIVPDGEGCAAGFECIVTVRAWSRPTSPNSTQVRDCESAHHEALTPQIEVTGWTTIDWGLQSSRTVRDPDGITIVAVSQFRFVLDPS